MKSIIVVCALAAVAHAKPCPKDIAKKVAPTYESSNLDPGRIRIRACVWGKFAGPGWLVYHVLPWPKDSKAETVPPGGIAFVAASGKLVATTGEGGGIVATVDARVVDLDGDGVDELVATYSVANPLERSSIEVLEVVRVTGQVVDASWKELSSRGDGVRCEGKLTDVRAVGKNKQLVVTVKEVSRPKRDDNPNAPPQSECELGAGRHVFVYVNGELTESK